MSDSDARGRVAEEASAAAVLILAGVVLQFAQRWASDPDAIRRTKMRAFLEAERFCATSAAGWWRAAERARLAYEAERT